ncbi:MAG: tRNA 2-thiouridine(34) synthase MnmA [Planctomycetota bacterium]
MPSERKSVLVAMSGGVDSSVAAALLQRQGWDVTGVFMCLGLGGADPATTGCCSPEDAADARRVANTLGIDMHVLNLSEQFVPIIDTFVDEYRSGRTPNPCILCNARVKFGRLVDLASLLGIDRVATGHYARIETIDSQAALLRGADFHKDQSYALFAVSRDVLGRMVLPIGRESDKQAVRAIARQLGLDIHDKPDSQEICFAPDDDYIELLRQRAPEALQPGEIVDTEGNVLGHHDGYARFTIGQRRGLGVAAGVPMYVVDIDPRTARVTIAPRAESMGRHLVASGCNWLTDVPDRFEATVQVRYNHRGVPGRVERTGDDSFRVELSEPVHAITPGQAAVLYDGPRLLGGGWIRQGRR